MKDPDVEEFVGFVELLTEEAPEGYTPWLFRVQQGSKAPALEYGSWKDDKALLSVDEAMDWMHAGGNVGIAGRPDDQLINVDIDDEDETTVEDLKPTLIARSRSRTGVHAFYFEAPGADIPNIPTDEAGEVRANWQYVVAPGSYVTTSPDDVPDDERKSAGFYTVERDDPVTSLRLEELPTVFKEQNQAEEREQEVLTPDKEDLTPVESHGSNSGLFDVSARDVVRKEGGSTQANDRWSSLFHSSDTGMNMSMSSNGLLHCWRHEVTHNGLQALAVLSDYEGHCQDVGAGHDHSGSGPSCLHREQGAHIWHAWVYAKRNGYIPEDDPVPYTALTHLCAERDLCPVSEIPNEYDPEEQSGRLPEYAYNAAIESIEGYDELDPGRERTDEFAKSEKAPVPPSSADTDELDEPTVSDGGETAADQAQAADGPSTQSPSANGMDWSDIRDMLRVAGDADEKAAPRFEAAMKLTKDYHFATLQENDQLYVYDSDIGIYGDDGEPVVRTELTQGLEEQYSHHGMSEALDHIRGRTLISEEDMGGPEGMIAARNCVIDLVEETSHDHSHEYKFLARLGAEFDKDATAPRFKAFLKEVVPNSNERQKLKEYAGYTLMHWALPYHKALFLVGPTASGKSTFLDAINTMLGEGTVSSLTPQQLTGERFSGAELFGKWANIRNDIPAATVKNTGQFKEVVGGDTMKAERKGKDPFMFQPKAKHLYAANQLPATETDDEAFYRRILLVPFPETIPEQDRDKHLDEKLEEELSGILNWAIGGLQKLLAENSFTGDRTPGHTQDTWMKWADSVSRFADAAIDDNSTEHLSKNMVYAAYVEFCRQEGIPTDTQHSMTRGLKKEGIQDGREYIDGEQQRAFVNIAFTGRGEQLLDDAKIGGDGDGEASARRESGLSSFD